MAKHDHKNQLLRFLPKAELAKVASDLVPVKLAFKERLYTEGKPLKHVYFVTSGVVSIVTKLSNGDVIETGTVGREGLVGLPAFHGVPTPAETTFCQVPGDGLRMDVKTFLAWTEQRSVVRGLILRYSYALLAMTSQIAACNRGHAVETRMARWLLMTQDRVDGPEFPLTQEFLGQMLGVQRQAVSLAGATLQNAGLIRYTRGRITVVNRRGLEEASCECYARIRDVMAHVTNGG